MQRKIIFTLNSGVLLLLTCAGCKSKEIPPPAEFINVPVYVAARTISADDQDALAQLHAQKFHIAISQEPLENPQRAGIAGIRGRPLCGSESPQCHARTAYRLPGGTGPPLESDSATGCRSRSDGAERYADALAGQITLATHDMRETREMVRKIMESQNSRKRKAEELTAMIDELGKRYGVVSDNLLKSSEYINKLEAELQNLQKEVELLKLQLRRKGN